MEKEEGIIENEAIISWSATKHVKYIKQRGNSCTSVQIEFISEVTRVILEDIPK